MNEELWSIVNVGVQKPKHLAFERKWKTSIQWGCGYVIQLFMVRVSDNREIVMLTNRDRVREPLSKFRNLQGQELSRTMWDSARVDSVRVKIR